MQPDLSKLSFRQTHIYRLIADEVNKEAIAARLYLADKTVLAHQQAMTTQLGLPDEAGLIRLANAM